MQNLFRCCKKTLLFAAKLALAGGIVWYLLLRDPEELLQSLSHLELWYLIPAVICYGLHIAVCSWRWRELAGIIRIPLGIFESFSLTMQGIFFSLVIPGGAIGGDVVKLGVISRRSASGSRTEGGFTVIMDRIIGMIALFSLVLVLTVPALPLLMKITVPGLITSNLMRIAAILGLAGLCCFGLAASGAVFFHRFFWSFPLTGKLLSWGNKITGGMVLQLTRATDTYVKNWKKLLFLVTASVFFVHLLTVVPLFFLLSALGVQYSFFDVIVAVSIGNVVGLLPIFPSGVGGRDLAIVTILAASGIAPESAKSAQLIYTAIILLYNLSGGIFFACDPGRKPDTANATEIKK